MVVFRLKGENMLTEHLLKRLNKRGNIHCVPASLKGKYVIRFTVTSTRTSIDDIIKDWSEIRNVATDVLEELNVKIDRATLKGTIHPPNIYSRKFTPLNYSILEIRHKNESFGSSLLLSNSPMSPKVVNGSFAAIFDEDEFLAKAYSGIRITVKFQIPIFSAEMINPPISFLESGFASNEAKSTWYPDERKAILIGLPNGPGGPLQR